MTQIMKPGRFYGTPHPDPELGFYFIIESDDLMSNHLAGYVSGAVFDQLAERLGTPTLYELQK